MKLSSTGIDFCIHLSSISLKDCLFAPLVMPWDGKLHSKRVKMKLHSKRVRMKLHSKRVKFSDLSFDYDLDCDKSICVMKISSLETSEEDVAEVPETSVNDRISKHVLEMCRKCKSCGAVGKSFTRFECSS